jgi:hypothetical protein
MTERPSPGEQIAGIAGLALILTMFLFAWFGFDVPSGGPDINGLDAFDAFGDWINIILVFAAFGGMMLALFGNGVARSPIPLSIVTTVLAGIGTIVLIIYVISPPGAPGFGGIVEVDLTREFGLWLGLIETIVLTYGGYRTMQEEGVSFGGAADRLSGPGGGWPGQGGGGEPHQGHQPHEQVPPYQEPPPPPQQPPAQQPPYQPPPAPPAHEEPPTQQQPPPPPPPPTGA